MNDHDHDDVIDDKRQEAAFTPRVDDLNEGRSPSSREQLRRQLMAEVEAFLARGGQIQQLEPMAQSEAKPASHGE